MEQAFKEIRANFSIFASGASDDYDFGPYSAAPDK